MSSRTVWRLSVWLLAIGSIVLGVTVYVEATLHGLADALHVFGDAHHLHVYVGVLVCAVGLVGLRLARRLEKSEDRMVQSLDEDRTDLNG